MTWLPLIMAESQKYSKRPQDRKKKVNGEGKRKATDEDMAPLTKKLKVASSSVAAKMREDPKLRNHKHRHVKGKQDLDSA